MSDTFGNQVGSRYTGMGTRRANFHHDAVARLGYTEVADEVQARYLAGDRAGAAAAIPFELVDDVALVGPVPRIRRRVAAWDQTLVTRIIAWTSPTHLPAVADALLGIPRDPAESSEA